MPQTRTRRICIGGHRIEAHAAGTGPSCFVSLNRFFFKIVAGIATVDVENAPAAPTYP
jgi:hypothetical protein